MAAHAFCSFARPGEGKMQKLRHPFWQRADLPIMNQSNQDLNTQKNGEWPGKKDSRPYSPLTIHH
jgi:hypothetical protein